ncbi:MAG: hypothetical protein JWM37_522 [Candidatus Saccharibacteria bacterium]|nr:hypothetical protein [Candidatus Saccharibacteria bacterium]
MHINKKLLFIIIPVIAIVSVPTYVFAKFTIDCDNQYKAALAQKQPLIDEFNQVALLGEEPAQKANVQRGGDCIDSKPYVTVSKSYSTSTNGGQAVDSVRSSLKTAGYTITREDFALEGCKLLYRVSAHNDHVNIYVTAHQKQIKDTSCTSGLPKGVPENYFRAQNIDATELNLKN